MLTSFSTRSSATGGNQPAADVSPTTASASTQPEFAINHTASSSLQSSLNSSVNASTGSTIVTPTSSSQKRDLAMADDDGSSKKRLLLSDANNIGIHNDDEPQSLPNYPTWTPVVDPSVTELTFSGVDWTSPPSIIQSAVDEGHSFSTPPSVNEAIDTLLELLQKKTSSDALSTVLTNYAAADEKIPKTKPALMRKFRKLINDRIQLHR
jgi:hypothetical protein